MDSIKYYMNYINIGLAAVLLIIFIVFLVKLTKISKNASLISNDSIKLSNNLVLMKDKTEAIKKTKDSFVFMGSLYLILRILKDAKWYRNKDYSISKSLTRSIMDNSRKLNRIKL